MSWLNFLHQHKGVAVVDNEQDREYTYEDLYRESCAWVQYLENVNLKAGDRVAYYHENSIDHLTLFFACTKLNLIFVPLNFKAPKLKIDSTIDNISPSLFLRERPEQLRYENDYDFTTISLNIPTLMLFTSGSTGNPKGVLIHGRMILANMKNTVENWNLKQEDISVVETPFFHTGAYNVLCLPLLSIGAKVILNTKFDVEIFYHNVSKRKVSIYFGVPTMFDMIAKHEKFSSLTNSSLRFLISGGAPCPEYLIERYQKMGLMFKQGYGLTEVGPNCFTLKEEDSLKKIGSIGKPVKNSSIMILDANNKPLEANQVGELAISGDHVCLGYYNAQSEYEKKLIQGHYKTGDLASFDKEGFFYIKGRKKEMYISGGENVFPQEVERVLMTHELIEQAQIVSVPDKKWGEVGFLFFKAKQSLNSEDIENYLSSRLARYKHPKFQQQINIFPLMENDKIDKRKLAKMAKDKI